ncbi:MAG: ComEA family DNA-binding protein [Thiotrichales bacterium]|nr:MAG: ComEA family DNA-binding protein [Thiotrichales bacterium]
MLRVPFNTTQGRDMKTLKSVIFIVLFSVSALIHAAQVNINTADAETLASELSGIGQSKAEAIIAYREKYGPYRQIEDLANVKGIGMATIDKNKPKLTLE